MLKVSLVLACCVLATACAPTLAMSNLADCNKADKARRAIATARQVLNTADATLARVCPIQ